MSTQSISASLTALDINNIITNRDAIALILVFLVNLTPEERKKLRKMATKREGYVSSVYNGALNNPSAIPSSFDMPEYTKDFDLMTQLKIVRGLLGPLMEGIDDTIMLLSNELMEQSDQCYGFLQTAAKGNPALTTLVNQIATAFAGQGKKKNATSITIPAGGSSNQQRINTRNLFINSGTTVLKVIKTGLAASYAKTVSPQSSLKLDPDWTVITVTNNSTTDEGEFTVTIKP
jgi:hypothetical protein